MKTLLSLSTLARAAILSLAVGSAALGAVPAQAQSHYVGPPFHGRPFYRPFIRPYPVFPIAPVYPVYPAYPVYAGVCLPDWQLRRVLNNSGFSNIAFFGYGRVRVQARAIRGPWAYRLTVNRCTGNIISAVRVARL